MHCNKYNNSPEVGNIWFTNQISLHFTAEEMEMQLMQKDISVYADKHMSIAK